MGTELDAFLRRVLRNTRFSLLGLAVVVGGDIAAHSPIRPVGQLAFLAGALVCLLAPVLRRARQPGDGVLVGLATFAVNAYAVLAALLLMLGTFIVS